MRLLIIDTFDFNVGALEITSARELLAEQFANVTEYFVRLVDVNLELIKELDEIDCKELTLERQTLWWL